MAQIKSSLAPEGKKIAFKIDEDNDFGGLENMTLIDENNQLEGRPDHFGRKSRASGEHMRLLKMYQCNQLSYQEIADKMTEYTGEKWSKSKVHYLLTK